MRLGLLRLFAVSRNENETQNRRTQDSGSQKQLHIKIHCFEISLTHSLFEGNKAKECYGVQLGYLNRVLCII